MSHHPAKTVTAAEVTLPADHGYRKLVTICLGLGLVGLGVSVAMRGGDKFQFAFSYLTAYMFWLSIALGGLFFTLIHFATRAGWSTVVRRLAENLMITLPLFAVLAIPIFVHSDVLYEWSHGATALGDPLIGGKEPYLNIDDWLLRGIAYVALWAFLAVFYYRQSTRQDESGEEAFTKKTQWLAPVGIVLFALTATFAAFDWMMSLSPHWYSTIYGVYFFAGSAVATFATLSLISMLLQRGGMLRDIVTTEHYHDLGKLMFGFTVFWTYIAFSQYFLIWYANIPEETVFYRMRWSDGWEPVTVLLMLGHFVIPFFFLMSRHIKRNRVTLAIGSLWMLFVHFVDMFWLIQPNQAYAQHGYHLAHAAEHAGAAGEAAHHAYEGFSFGLLDITTLVGIGGLAAAVFFWRLFSKPMVPVKDPRLPESLAFENFPTN